MTIMKAALRSTLLSLTLLLVTFVGGLLAGAAVERTVRGSDSGGEDRREEESRRDSRERGERDDRNERPRGYMSQLNLSEAQQASIDSILEHGREETKAFWQEEGQRLREIVEETRSGIHSVFTPEQREQYEEMRRHRGRNSRGGQDSRDGQNSRDGHQDSRDGQESPERSGRN